MTSVGKSHRYFCPGKTQQIFPGDLNLRPHERGGVDHFTLFYPQLHTIGYIIKEVCSSRISPTVGTRRPTLMSMFLRYEAEREDPVRRMFLVRTDDVRPDRVANSVSAHSPPSRCERAVLLSDTVQHSDKTKTTVDAKSGPGSAPSLFSCFNDLRSARTTSIR